MKFEKTGGKDMPQINHETGISQDYKNEFSAIMTLTTHNEPDMDDKELNEEYEYLTNGAVSKRGKPILEYEEKYPTDEFFDVVNDKNRAGVEEINKIVREIAVRI